MTENPRTPKRFTDPDRCVEETLSRVGRRVVLGLPLGLGKPVPLVDAFFRRAQDDPELELEIVTALSLARPGWSGELERRLVEPLGERVFGSYPDPAYVGALERGEMPPNVGVTEFYLEPARWLDQRHLQSRYVSSNYSHVARDVLDRGVNVVAQLVAGDGGGEGGERFSLSSNPDVTLDLLEPLRRRRGAGEPVAILGEVHPRLPFMEGDAVLPASSFDAVVEPPGGDFDLFGPPNEPVSTADYLIALHTSALVADGGTLQLGIGSLGDAVTHLLKLRHERNADYRTLLADAGVLDRWGTTIDRLGGTDPFDQGLYAATEMLVEGFLHLHRSGILSRRVYGHPVLQRLVDDRRIGEEVIPETLRLLLDQGAISPRPDRAEVERWQRLGVLHPGLQLDGGELVLPGGGRVPAELDREETFAAVADAGLGERLDGGAVAHAGFFLGPRSFYEGLREMDPEERRRIVMTRISFVNRLAGAEELKRAQRRRARFVNSALVATLLGAVASDGLEDGRVLSGVGGQYDFVAMAHDLDDGRSILMLPAVRESGGETISNVRWSYGHTTIPRHLRDLVVTEYGIADLRGKTDREVVDRMLRITDARFQDELLEKARQAGKVDRGYRLPDRYRENTPERLEALLRPGRERGLFPRFPFGTDLTAEEVALGGALKYLQKRLARRRPPLPDLRQLRGIASPPAAARPYLERMGLDRPRGLRERAMQKAVLYALFADGVL